MLALLMTCALLVWPAAVMSANLTNTSSGQTGITLHNFGMTSCCDEFFALWDQYKETLVRGGSDSFVDACARLDNRIEVRQGDDGRPITTCGSTASCLVTLFSGQCIDITNTQLREYAKRAKAHIKKAGGSQPDWLAMSAARLAINGDFRPPPTADPTHELQIVGTCMKDVGLQSWTDLGVSLDDKDDGVQLPRIFVPYLAWYAADVGHQHNVSSVQCLFGNHVFVIVKKSHDNFRILQGWAGSHGEQSLSLNEYFASDAGSMHRSGIDKVAMKHFMAGLYGFLHDGLVGTFNSTKFSALFPSTQQHFAGKPYYPAFSFFEVSSMKSTTPLLKQLVADAGSTVMGIN